MLQSIDAAGLDPSTYPHTTALRNGLAQGFTAEALLAGARLVCPLDQAFIPELVELWHGEQYTVGYHLAKTVAAAARPYPAGVLLLQAGVAAAGLEEWEEAIALYHESLASLDGVELDWALEFRVINRNNIAWAYHELGEPALGLPWAEEGVALDPRFPILQGTLGSILWALEREEEALEHMGIAMSLGLRPEPAGTMGDDPRWHALTQAQDHDARGVPGG